MLIVDDDPAEAAFVGGVLQAAGYTPDWAPGGREALAMADSRKFSAMIVEILMLDFDGIELISALRRGGQDCPIIATTAGGRRVGIPYVLGLAEAVGADATLPKPFTECDVVAALSVLLAGRQT